MADDNEISEMSSIMAEQAMRHAELNAPTLTRLDNFGVHPDVQQMVDWTSRGTVETALDGRNSSWNLVPVDSRGAGLSSWSVYWDYGSQVYEIHDPRVIVDGTRVMIAENRCSISSGIDIYCNVWRESTSSKSEEKEESYTWHATIDNSPQPEDKGLHLLIAHIGDLSKPGTITQFHTGAVVYGGGGGGGGSSGNQPWEIDRSGRVVGVKPFQLGTYCGEASGGVTVSEEGELYCDINIIEKTAQATTTKTETVDHVSILIARVLSYDNIVYYCRYPIAPVWEMDDEDPEGEE